MHPTEASDTGLTHRKYEDLKRYVQEVHCVAVGEIGLDPVQVMQDKGRNQQTEMFSRVCRPAKEVGKHVVFHCRGAASTAKECLWIMKSNLPKDQMVYWHHLNKTDEIAREVEAAFPNAVFGVASAILKEQLDDQLEKLPQLKYDMTTDYNKTDGPLPTTRSRLDTIYRRHRVRFRSDHNTHQHTHCQQNFHKHHTDGRQAEHTKGQDAQQLQALARRHSMQNHSKK